MRKLSLKHQVCIFISWVLVFKCSAGERDYFYETTNLTWEEARNHCQVCFKDLVTLTPENIQTIAREHNITSDCWVGLRKNSNSTSNSTMPWSRWANGDHLLFQNWYPGWPVFKSPERYFCIQQETTTPTTTSTTDTMVTPHTETDTTEFGGSTSEYSTLPTDYSTSPTQYSTSPNQNSTSTNDSWVINSQPPVESKCVPVLDVPRADTNYIEDSCVAMLSFGAWVEKNCLEVLPFICYEDRFFGHVNLTNRTSQSTVLTWQPGPGIISHYRIEVSVDKQVTNKQTDNLTYEFDSLTPGTRHSVKVFPVKCGRDLNPQEIVFYTTPNKVVNLTAINVTENSICLSWIKPAGNVDFYLIKVQGDKWHRSKVEHQEVNMLTPGTRYTFTVLSGVEDNSTWSEEFSISKYTKPGKVSNLRVFNNSKDSLVLNWMAPEGRVTGYRVKAMSQSNSSLFDEEVNKTEVVVGRLPAGTEITLTVAALAGGSSLEGDKETVVNYTSPGPISDLVLVTTYDSLNATWTLSDGNASSYTVELQLDGQTQDTKSEIKEPTVRFNNLKNSANYTVVVYAFVADIKGPPVTSSKFTKPSPPTNVTVVDIKKNNLTLKWTAPVNTSAATYSVTINSSFWEYSSSYTLDNKTSHTFYGLKSGTKYSFEVKTVADGDFSSPETASAYTVAEKREISLSMLCSSAEALLCDNSTTRNDVFDQLKAHFNKLLKNDIFWELTKQESENINT
ncbi:receptor-type tyrosine-protein phosphatase eta-like isoform X2 [Plectropomus leopardus]|uniref:receptor-type tyrosine-protein phosphatase eta-like isoform X2 n=1 Tax=Plectropomus leopardus TaxID=160734 RepID=UPI001C4D9940|nr:receptor-type tyrosine-protein phosphatase eta-like isoform X2 [Plectropomus leopardus]